jgi:hypothetical protein
MESDSQVMKAVFVASRPTAWWWWWLFTILKTHTEISPEKTAHITSNIPEYHYYSQKVKSNHTVALGSLCSPVALLSFHGHWPLLRAITFWKLVALYATTLFEQVCAPADWGSCTYASSLPNNRDIDNSQDHSASDCSWRRYVLELESWCILYNYLR